MFVYIDESGNSGTHLFDPSQPYFYSLAMTCSVDFDIVSQRRMKHVRELLGCDELHANDLGLSRICSISNDLIKIAKKYRLKFNYVVVEKTYVSLVRLFDCIFDSHDNPSVPWTSYNIGAFRDLLLVQFAQIVEDKVIIDFWNGCMMEKNRANATSSFLSICKRLASSLDEIQDKRAREIVSNAIDWAGKYPDEIVFSFDDKQLRLMGAANFVAFTMIVPRLCSPEDGKSKRIKKIIHDEQNQFKKTFEYYHEVSRQAQKVIFPEFSGFQTIDFSPLKESSFSMRSSVSSNGLQFVDICLYLIKKMHGGFKIEGEAGKLLEYIARRTDSGEYTLSMMYSKAEMEYNMIMNLTLTDEQIENGHKMVADVEERRLSAMKEFEEKNTKKAG